MFLGTILVPAEKNDDAVISLEGRVYVGAVGGRVDSASGRDRLLLGPEGPADLRLFAISTRLNPGDPVTDHLVIDSANAIQILSRSAIGTGTEARSATLRSGHRPVRFRPGEICSPFTLARRIAEGSRPVEQQLVKLCSRPPEEIRPALGRRTPHPAPGQRPRPGPT